jgi:hypothetical protein
MIRSYITPCSSSHSLPSFLPFTLSTTCLFLPQILPPPALPFKRRYRTVITTRNCRVRTRHESTGSLHLQCAPPIATIDPPSPSVHSSDFILKLLIHINITVIVPVDGLIALIPRELYQLQVLIILIQAVVTQTFTPKVISSYLSYKNIRANRD